MQKPSIETISSKSPDFPDKLQNLPQPIKQLQATGNTSLLASSNPILGIVGARKVTGYGREITEVMAAEAARRGVIIVSGLALGVDSIAHKATLDACGATIAVLPSGLEKIYPANHHQLARQIIDSGGLLVSEYEADFMPYNFSFVERNRIIAALSDVLLVTEAAEKSGSLHTARFALEMGKTVAAVPGNITSPMSRGCNNLIRSGAVPILDPSDLLTLLNISEKTTKEARYRAENEIEASILTLLDTSARSGHELLNESGLEPAIFQTHLTMLEIKGVIEPTGNNNWRLR
jgi:DNA processing protein